MIRSVARVLLVIAAVIVLALAITADKPPPVDISTPTASAGGRPAEGTPAP